MKPSASDISACVQVSSTAWIVPRSSRATSTGWPSRSTRIDCSGFSSSSEQTATRSGMHGDTGALLTILATDGFEIASRAPSKASLHRPGDPSGLQLRSVGDRSTELRIKILGPQLQPSIEMFRTERMPSMEDKVDLQRVATILAGAPQHGLPEVAHDR